MGKLDLHDLLLGQQRELAVALGVGRDLIGHPGAMGSTSETQWREMLCRFLPGRYEVATQVTAIDADGESSDLLDLVIHDRHHSPLLFERDGDIRYIPAESVYAAFEVKQELTRREVLYAIDKAKSLRKLRRTSAPFVNAGGQSQARELFPIVTGILATESSWRPDPFGKALREALSEADEAGQLQLGCALEDGAFEASYSGGTADLDVSTQDAGLLFLLLRLFEHLRQMGTVPAIDLREYGRTIEKD